MAKKRVVRIAGEKIKREDSTTSETPQEDREELISKILEENPVQEGDIVDDEIIVPDPKEIVAEPVTEESIPTEDFNAQLRLLMGNRHKQTNPQAYAKSVEQVKSVSASEVIINQESTIKGRNNSVVTSRHKQPVSRSSSMSSRR